jgi:hypothetical protein
MTPPYRKKLIEVALPLKADERNAACERNIALLLRLITDKRDEANSLVSRNLAMTFGPDCSNREPKPTQQGERIAEKNAVKNQFRRNSCRPHTMQGAILQVVTHILIAADNLSQTQMRSNSAIESESDE